MINRKKSQNPRKGLGRREFLKVYPRGRRHAGRPDDLRAQGLGADGAGPEDGPLEALRACLRQVLRRLRKEFGETHQCKVRGGLRRDADLPTAIAADISRGGGHDIFHLNGTGAWLYDQVEVDVTDLANRLGKQFGGWTPGAEDIAVVKGKWLAIPHWYISYPWIVEPQRTSNEVRGLQLKDHLQDIVRIGAKLKKAGHPVGIPFSQTPDANDNLVPSWTSFKAYTFDKHGNIAFSKKEIVEVLKWGTSLFKDSMTDEVLSWDDTSNNRFIASGKGSMVCNPISAPTAPRPRTTRTSTRTWRSLQPLGPAGRVGGARTMSYGIYKFAGPGPGQGVPLRDERRRARGDGGLHRVQPPLPQGVPQEAHAGHRPGAEAGDRAGLSATR